MSWESPPPQASHPYKTRPTSFQVHDVRGGPMSDDDLVGIPTYDMDNSYGNERQYQAQPAYTNPHNGAAYEKAEAPWWNPKSWRKRTWAIVAVVIIVILIAVIVGAVLGSKANAYPDYSALSYSLSDECMSFLAPL